MTPLKRSKERTGNKRAQSNLKSFTVCSAKRGELAIQSACEKGKIGLKMRVFG